MQYMKSGVMDVVVRVSLGHNVTGSYIVLKRVLDIIFSLLCIVLAFPVMIITAAAIKIDSPGPVLFTQYRCGFGGKVFKMYKFRSMIADAEKAKSALLDKNETSGSMFKIKADPRVTRVGRIIRKTSIDELPQLINVLKGEMSMVGPRPPIVDEVEDYDRWHNLRMSVKPGMTGLWQISGRSDVGFEEMVRLDLKYIRERSLLYDMRILIRTIPVLFGDKNAF